MALLLFLLSFVVAAGPMISFVAIVWWLDRYDREPLGLIALTFVWGAMGAVTLALVGGGVVVGVADAALGALAGLLDADLGLVHEAIDTLLVAPLVEEPSKALFLWFVLWSRHFDNTVDGFVYGAVAGLGFAMTENFAYFVGVVDQPGTWGGTVVLRTFYSALMHATATATVGAALGFGRFRGPWVLFGTGNIGLALAMAIHATWNGLIVLENASQGHGAYFLLDLLLFPVELAVAFGLFQFSLWHEAKVLRAEFAGFAARGLLPLEHVDRLASWRHRQQPSWIEAGIPASSYITTATALAHRTRQARLMGARSTPDRAEEVERLTARLASLLAARAPGPGPDRRPG